MKSFLITLFTLLLITMFVGCQTATVPEPECLKPIAISVSIEGGPIITNNYPTIHIKAENATCMAFSCDKVHWTWHKYQETYTGINVEQLPTIKSNELKILYVKFKNECGESEIISTSFIYSKPEPTMIASAIYFDANNNQTVDTDDVVTVTFNRDVDMNSLFGDATLIFDLYNNQIGDVEWGGLIQIGINHKELKIVFNKQISSFVPGLTKIKVKNYTLLDTSENYVSGEPIIIQSVTY